MIEVNKHNKNRLMLTYYITMACNNRCPYCYTLKRLDNNLKFNHEVFDQFKKAFNEIDRSTKIDLTLLGGEPLFVDDIKRINELDYTNTSLVIFSNLNYNESVFRERLELINGLDYWIACSLHESSNLDDVKRNLLYLHENFANVEVSFLISTENIDRMKDHVEFAIQHGVPYTINPLRSGDFEEYVNFFDDDYGDNTEMLKRWLNDSLESGEVMFGDRILTSEEVHEFRIPEISHMYYVQCNPSPFAVSYDGSIKTSCEYNYVGHVSKGFDFPRNVFCSNKTCICDPLAYKKLLRPKDREKNKKFHEYFND